MLVWDDSAGTMSLNGRVIGGGYSGAGVDKNNPLADAHIGTGPIPVGQWIIDGVKDSPNTGPFSIVLLPAVGTDTHGRSAFRIHGDSIAAPGTASHGCIILPLAVRRKIWASKERFLTVTT